jgi:hypothetical protein
MGRSNPDQISAIDVRGARRVLLAIPVGLFALGVYLSGCWYFGNTLAEYAPPLDQGGRENALSAVRLAPRDPLSHWVLANMEKSSLDQARWPEAIREYEEAVRLSPNDYRLWMDLGRAREQSGDPAAGEQALRRAVELGPAYGYPRWYLGNLLLRQGRRDEAFAELRLAGEANNLLRPQVFVLAWHFYEQDVAALESNLATSSEARAQLALFLASQERPDDSVRIWNALPAEAKTEWAATGDQILKALYEAKSYRAGVEMERSLRPDRAAERGKVTNAGFEQGIGGDELGLFNWHVNSVPQAKVSLDPNAFHSGHRSLRINFSGYGEPYFLNIWQVVTVEPNTNYRLQFFVKTEDLASAGPPVFQIFDPQDPKTILAVQSTGVTGSNDWQEVALDFKTGATTQGVAVRTNRVACPAGCTIFGTIWYDDFNLQPVAPAGKPAG